MKITTQEARRDMKIKVVITPRVAQELMYDLSVRIDWLEDNDSQLDATMQNPAEIRRVRTLRAKVLSCTQRTNTITLKQSDGRDLLGQLDETGRGMPNGSLWTALQNVMEGIECQLSLV